MLLLSARICFHGEIRKFSNLLVEKSALSRAVFANSVDPDQLASEEAN